MRLFLWASALVLVACSGRGAEIEVGSPAPPVDDKEARATAEAPPAEIPQGAFTGPYGGCSNVVMYRASEDGTQYAVIELDKDMLGLAVGATRTLDLGEEPAGVGVFVDVYGSSLGELPYCTDYRTEEPAVTRWTAEAGSLTIELHADPEANGEQPTYRATLVLERAHFTRPNAGRAIVVPRVIIDNVRVGWLPG